MRRVSTRLVRRNEKGKLDSNSRYERREFPRRTSVFFFPLVYTNNFYSLRCRIRVLRCKHVANKIFTGIKKRDNIRGASKIFWPNWFTCTWREKSPNHWTTTAAFVNFRSLHWSSSERGWAPTSVVEITWNRAVPPPRSLIWQLAMFWG